MNQPQLKLIATVGDATVSLPVTLAPGQTFNITNYSPNPVHVLGHEYTEFDLKKMGYVKYRRPWWKFW